MDRPFILLDGDKMTHLFVATNDGNEADFPTLTRSWNACIPLKKSKSIAHEIKGEIQLGVINSYICKAVIIAIITLVLFCAIKLASVNDLVDFI